MMHSRTRIDRLLPALLVLAAAAGSAATATAQGRERVVNIVMEDQFRNRRETSVMRGSVVVLVYAERRGAEAAGELGRRLHVHFHPTAEGAAGPDWGRQPVVGPPGWPAGVPAVDVHAVAVACLGEVPRALQPVARAQARKDSPFVPVWLDFDGTMESTFGLVPAEPNVAVIDPEGRPHSVLSGRLDELKFRELVATIDQIRLQSRPMLRTAAAPGGTTR